MPDEEASQSPAYYLEDTATIRPAAGRCDDWSETHRQSARGHEEPGRAQPRHSLPSVGSATEKATLHDLAAKYNVSAERIRQLEKNAMEKVKALMEA
jgi:RNA polymerase sigma-32 factor